MPRRTVVFFLLLSSILAAGVVTGLQPSENPSSHAQEPTCSFPITMTDATGEQVRLDSEPTRIVALAPSDAQVLWDINASDKVVGMPVSQYTAYLDNHSAPRDITGQDGLTITIEQVVALEPDLVLAGNITNRDTVNRLRDANLTVYHFHTATTIDDIKKNIRTAGSLTGACEGAETRIHWITQELSAIQHAIADQPKPLVFLAMGDGWTAGHNTFQHEILVRAGAENLATATRANITGWKIISEEIVHTEDPDWIVYSDTFDDPPLRQGDRLTTAYETNQTIAVNAHYLNQPGPRVVIVTKELARHFHPQTDNQSTTPLDTTQSPTITPASAPTQPGLTLLTPVLALGLLVVISLFRDP